MSPVPKLDLARLYAEHGHVVVRRARQILGDDAEALEILQDVFVSLLDRPEQFHGKSQITTFLYSMTTHACLNRLRNQRRRTALLEEAPSLEPRPTGAGADLSVAASQLLAALPDRLMQVAIHYYIDEMTHEEIAEILGVSRRHVGNLIQQVQEEARKLSRAA